MTPATANVIVAVVTLIGVLITGYWAKGAKSEANTAKHVAKSANRHAEQAVEYGRPTGNGFAADVRRQLTEIAAIATDGRDAALRAEDKADAAHAAVNRHLEAHANHGLQVITGGARE